MSSYVVHSYQLGLNRDTTKSLLDALSLQVKIQKFSLEFIENVTVEDIWKLHPPVLSVDDKM